ncbi:tRNA uridine-5-carboxymethylaminomethyl(34) synthesis GTPase MnmE [Caldisericum exile]|uniref:tRNA modification GTPase MnmE n=1 Tax=Caldisericum exile (strain DSM 21853 / NBRC 104410 / AZM16c01) TaxID=511051 RepID=A0A7U6GFT2_CALEA|nr:tRNA uridine-5-carboxymethylaminomethyl(34) synthesis GTPase MnmE [Caldisericum exile]BAL81613.1 tRNA modification GTPase MnmE [Caldisericum exile AZM16c01]
MSDTIVAISTPRGFGGIGVVRLSGDKALELTQKIFNKKIELPRYAYYGAISIEGTPIDTGIVIYYRKPHSYTGEDVVEISMHGGIKNLEMVLNHLISLGARLAEKGEFTRRAVENGKMDIFEANAVIELIEAKTEKGVLLASSRLFGKLSKVVESVRKKIHEVNLQIEATIDFPMDVEEIPHNVLKNSLNEIKNEIEKLLSTYRDSKVIIEGVRIAIVGKPNVGKSTLLNALLRFERAIVSEIPGTTRDTIEETIDFYGFPVKIIDTAGIRESEDIIEKMGVERSKRAIETSDLILFVFDASAPLTEDDLELAKFTEGKMRIIVLNKSDLPKALTKEELLKLFPNEPVIEISALLKEGIDAVESEIKKKLLNIDIDSILVSNKIEYDLLSNALTHIENAIEILDTGTLDLVSEELREAIEILSGVSGENIGETVLRAIFERFCIGK